MNVNGMGRINSYVKSLNFEKTLRQNLKENLFKPDVKEKDKDLLAVTAAEDVAFKGTSGIADGRQCKLCPLDRENAAALRKVMI